MSKPHIEELVTSIGMPLRDVAKTLRAASHASEARLKESARILPEPLRHLIKDTVRRADRLGNRLLDPAMPGADQIALASRTLRSGGDGLEHVANLARVVSFGLNKALHRLGENDSVVSDSRLAMIAASVCSNRDDAGLQTADLMQAIIHSHAILSLGKLAPGTSDTFTSAKTLVTFATLLWISLDRVSPQDEGELLLLCIDLTRSSQGEIAASLASQRKLQAQFDRLAQII